MYTQREIAEKLLRFNVPIEMWGTGETRTFKKFVEEVQSGEVILEEQEGKLVRCSEGVGVNVYYMLTRSCKLVLKEEKQVEADGRERKRDVLASIGEKLQPSEDPTYGAYRCLREELSIEEQLNLLCEPSLKKGPVASQSYPGLLSQYTLHMFSVYLPHRLYRDRGYIEKQKDKTNYYKWTFADAA
jgi:hypothetical protein